MRWHLPAMALVAALVWCQSVAAAAACHPEIRYIAPPLNACLGRQTVRIAAVGDVLLHSPLQRRGYADGNGFHAIWGAAEPYFRAADIAYANLEGPVAPGVTRGRHRTVDPGPVFDNRVYTSYPMFNYNPQVVADLKASGVDIVSTANNHAMDRGSAGADLTIAALKSVGLAFSGTITAGSARRFVTYTATRIGRIAWIACSFSTNGLPDAENQVLLCYDNRQELLATISREAARADVAAVIVTPHWGYEYNHRPNANQRTLAAEMALAGATAVIGTHPHVVQPWDNLPKPDGSRSLVIYSTGNFVSGQGSLAKRTGVLAWVELCRQPPARDLAAALHSRLVVAQAGWVPLVMNRTVSGPELSVAGKDATGLAAQGRKLVARLVPAPGLTAELVCPKPENPVIALQ